MNTHLIGYIKRDAWFESGINLGVFLRKKEELIKAGMEPKKAAKLMRKLTWKGLKNGLI